MKTVFSISILGFFLLGSLFLPQGDFSVLPQLPKMYDHCKSFEDGDMNLFDFVFDHLMGIDGSFDKHEGGDEEKPHTSTPFQNQQHQSIFNTVSFVLSQSILELKNFISLQTITVFYPEKFVLGIFRPPSL